MMLWLLGCAGCNDDTLLESGAAIAAGEWPCDDCEGACVDTYDTPTSASHVEGNVEYADEPPTSGDHNSCWATWGVHTEPVAAENWVHNMEHGGVIFLYDCPTGCDEELAQLTAYVESLPPGRALLSPYAPSEYTFTVVSWGYRLELGCLDLPAIQAFYNQHVGHGPEDVTAEPSSSCM